MMSKNLVLKFIRVHSTFKPLIFAFTHGQKKKNRQPAYRRLFVTITRIDLAKNLVNISNF